MFTGTVKFFNESKGFGFIVEENSNQEIFVHITGLVDKIRENDRVSFETIDGRKEINGSKAKNAINVRKIA